MYGPDFIASDVHLGAVPAGTERAFLAFLEHVRLHGRSLSLIGDLFDFWFEYGTIIPGKHFRVLGALAALVEAGVRVRMVGGNHDAWGGRFLRDEVGVEFEADSIHCTLAGRPALLVHGDGLGRSDASYRVAKRILRSRLAIALFRGLHPELGEALARRVSSTEGKAPLDGESHVEARGLEAWARDRLARDPTLGWVACGHVHLPAVVEVAPGQYYLNAGDWIHHHTFISIDEAGRPSLHRWDADLAGDDARPATVRPDQAAR